MRTDISAYVYLINIPQPVQYQLRYIYVGTLAFPFDSVTYIHTYMAAQHYLLVSWY